MNAHDPWTPGGYRQSLNRMHRLSGKPVKVRYLGYQPRDWFQRGLGWLFDWVFGRKSSSFYIEDIIVHRLNEKAKSVITCQDLPFRHIYHYCRIDGHLHACMGYGKDTRCPFRAPEETGYALPYWEIGQILGGN